jgi:hypothetical protein
MREEELRIKLLQNLMDRREWETVDDVPLWISEIAEKLLNNGWVKK